MHPACIHFYLLEQVSKILVISTDCVAFMPQQMCPCGRVLRDRRPKNQRGKDPQCSLGGERPWHLRTSRPAASDRGARGRFGPSSFSQPLSHLCGEGQGVAAAFWPLPMLPSMESLRGPRPACRPLERGAPSSGLWAMELRSARSRLINSRPAAIPPTSRTAITAAESTSALGTAFQRVSDVTDRQAGSGWG